METSPIDTLDSRYVYSLPGQTGAAIGKWLILRVILLVASGASLFTLIFVQQDKILSNDKILYLVFILAVLYIQILFYTIYTRLWSRKFLGYSVALDNHGLSVEGSHLINGNQISWQEIDKIKLASWSAGLEISTYRDVGKIIIPCELKRLPPLLSLMAQYIEANQPNRSYPELFTVKYRYIKRSMILFLVVMITILVYTTQDMPFLLLYFIVGFYGLVDSFLIQKIALSEDRLTLYRPWRSKTYPYSTIKQIHTQYGHRENGTEYYIVLVIGDQPKTVSLLMKGFDPANIYLALHQAWQKAKTSTTKSNFGTLGFYTTR